jgi:predicted PurR-regulated permease PerM
MADTGATSDHESGEPGEAFVAGMGPIRTQLETLMPPGGRGRRVVGWGVVAWSAIGLAVLLWAGWRVLGRFAGIIPYLVMALLVVFLLGPPAKRLAAHRVPYRLAATLVFVVSVAIGAIVLALVIPALVHQTGDLVKNSESLVAKGGATLFDRFSHSSSPILRKAGDTITKWVQSHAGNVQAFLRTITGAGLRLAHFSLVLLLGGFLGYLLLLALPQQRSLAGTLPASFRERFDAPLAEVRRIVGGYLRARLIVSTVVGVLATFGLWLIHMPFWLPLGIFVGIANLVPMLGAWIGGIPVAIVALLTKPPSYLLLVLVVIVISHMVDGYILSPIVLKETTKLHPVVVLLAVLLGADLAGFWGIIAAIPVAGVIQFGIREWVLPRWRDTTADETGTSALEAGPTPLPV